MGTTSTTRRNGARSRIAGVPTVLPPPAHGVPTLLTLPDDRARSEPLPGVVHLPGWLDPAEQEALVAAFRGWAAPPAGLRHPRVPTGHLMSVQSVCLGWHWQPYAYSRTADDTDGAPVKPLPPDVRDLGRRAVADTFGADEGGAYEPDAADREPLRAGREARPAPGRRGAVGRAGRHHQPR